METYLWGFFVAGLVLFFEGFIDMATDLAKGLSKKSYVGWSLRMFVGIVLAVFNGILIFIQ